MASDDNPDKVPDDSPSAGEDICRRCGGTGTVEGEECSDCKGTGKITTPIGGA